jgi:hypothetical protein
LFQKVHRLNFAVKSRSLTATDEVCLAAGNHAQLQHHLAGADMNRLKILPGAAGVIALTASTGFFDGQRKIDTESPVRDRIAIMSMHADVASGIAPRLVVKPGGSAYLVEITRGETSSGILVNALTGQVLLA